MDLRIELALWYRLQELEQRIHKKFDLGNEKAFLALCPFHNKGFSEVRLQLFLLVTSFVSAEFGWRWGCCSYIKQCNF